MTNDNDSDSDNDKNGKMATIETMEFLLMYNQPPGKLIQFKPKNYDMYWNQFATDFNIC